MPLLYLRTAVSQIFPIKIFNKSPLFGGVAAKLTGWVLLISSIRTGRRHASDLHWRIYKKRNPVRDRVFIFKYFFVYYDITSL